MRAVRERPLDPDWVERTVTDLERLVAAGDETGLPSGSWGWWRERRDGRRGWKPDASVHNDAPAIMDLIEQIGALLGLAAFLGLAVLVLLYFQQARDVRRLREWAGRAPERAEAAAEEAVAAAAEEAGLEPEEDAAAPVGGPASRARWRRGCAPAGEPARAPARVPATWRSSPRAWC